MAELHRATTKRRELSLEGLVRMTELELMEVISDALFESKEQDSVLGIEYTDEHNSMLLQTTDGDEFEIIIKRT